MGKTDLMQERIAKQRELPNDIKEKLNGVTFINLLISIAMMIYMIVINLLFINEPTTIFSTATKASALSFAVIDIIFFEIAYRKESITLTIHSIEFLIICLFALSIPYIYLYVEPVVRNITMISPVFLSIYYIIKLIMIHLLETNRYRNNLSDVLEILQDDVGEQSYIDAIEVDGPNIDVNEDELIEEVQEIKKKANMEKQMLKDAKKKEKKDD